MGKFGLTFSRATVPLTQKAIHWHAKTEVFFLVGVDIYILLNEKI